MLKTRSTATTRRQRRLAAYVRRSTSGRANHHRAWQRLQHAAALL